MDSIVQFVLSQTIHFVLAGMKLLAFLVAAVPLALASNGSHEGALRQAIFAGYDKLARPDHQVKWGVGLNLLSLP